MDKISFSSQIPLFFQISDRSSKLHGLLSVRRKRKRSVPRKSQTGEFEVFWLFLVNIIIKFSAEPNQKIQKNHFGLNLEVIVDSKGIVLYGTKSRLVHETFYTNRKVPFIQSNCESFLSFIRKNRNRSKFERGSIKNMFCKNYLKIVSHYSNKNKYLDKY